MDRLSHAQNTLKDLLWTRSLGTTGDEKTFIHKILVANFKMLAARYGYLETAFFFCSLLFYVGALL